MIVCVVVGVGVCHSGIRHQQCLCGRRWRPEDECLLCGRRSLSEEHQVQFTHPDTRPQRHSTLDGLVFRRDYYLAKLLQCTAWYTQMDVIIMKSFFHVISCNTTPCKFPKMIWLPWFLLWIVDYYSLIFCLCLCMTL